MLMNKNQLKKWMSVFLLALAIIIVYKAVMEIDTVIRYIKTFIGMITPFIVGFVIAYILHIPVNGFNNFFTKFNIRFIRKNSKALSILTTYILFIFVIIFALSILIPAVYNSAKDFIDNFDRYYNDAYTQLTMFIKNLDESWNIPFDFNLEAILGFTTIDKILDKIGLENILSSLVALLSVSSYILNGALAFIASIYFLLEKENFISFIKRLLKAFISEKYFNILIKYTKNINNYFKSFIYCQIIDAFILGTISTIGLTVIGSKYALSLGPMLGLFNIIPYFGAIIGSLITVIIIAITNGLTKAVIGAVFLMLLQQIDGNVIQPKLLGVSLSLNPLLIIVSITIGGAAFGVMGMVIAIPLVTVLKNIVEDIITYKESSN